MKTYINPTEIELNKILQRPEVESKDLEIVVKTVFEEVKKDGDKALIKLTKEFDKVELNSILVSDNEIEEAEKLISTELKTAIIQASKNIELFHRAQMEAEQKIETMPGVFCWRKSIGIEKVGLYIPGGTAPLFSTVLMLGIPAKVANCNEVILCTPPSIDGTINPAILFAAKTVGIKSIYKVGGIQAIAAMSIGTESITKVYKIFGPGNQYVTAAKQYAQRLKIAIDMPAGPSEVMVVCDDDANAQFVASDLLSQAEHGSDSQVILVSTSEEKVKQVNIELDIQLNDLPRKEIATEALLNSTAIVCSKDKLMSVINEYAPEHLILNTKFNEDLIPNIINAGSVFIGQYSAESAGDYASGTNHTLPTNGYAKQYSGVSLDSFVKKITFQKISEEGILNLGKTVEVMAEAEGLFAHKNAITVRLKSLKK
jgi:histidinol dehydrogenase